jgi:murein DD-endopeptidase MepM/ murein hydrolase activator NlpD
MIKKGLNLIFRCFLIVAITTVYLFQPLITTAKAANNIQDLKANLAELKQEKAEKANQKADTEDQIAAKKSNISKSYTEKENIANQVDDTKNKIVESQNEIEKTSKDIDSILKYYQLTMDSNEYLEYITGASTTTELIMRASAVEQISTYYKNKIESLKNLIVEKQKLQADLTSQSAELDQKITNYANALDSLNDQLDEINDTADDMDTQINRLEEQIKYYQSVCNSETQALNTCVNDPQSFGWLRPLVRGHITSNFGYRNGSFHNAYDIGGNPEGTPEYATAAGRVAYVKNRTHCGGNIVYLYVTVNGQRYTLEYAHMLNIEVKLNQIVNTDTVIGTVGGYTTSTAHGGYDACSGGTHLHYGVSTGWYGVDYKTWSQFLAHAIKPIDFPNIGVWWYKR